MTCTDQPLNPGRLDGAGQRGHHHLTWGVLHHLSVGRGHDRVHRSQRDPSNGQTKQVGVTNGPGGRFAAGLREPQSLAAIFIFILFGLRQNLQEIARFSLPECACSSSRTAPPFLKIAPPHVGARIFFETPPLQCIEYLT